MKNGTTHMLSGKEIGQAYAIDKRKITPWPRLHNDVRHDRKKKTVVE